MRWRDALKVGLRAGAGVDPRHVALRRDDHRRAAVRPVAPGGDRVLVLPRDPDADRRRRLRRCEEPRTCSRATICRLFGVGFVAAFVSAFLCVRWLLRYISHHDFTVVRLVPHRVRRGDPGHRLGGCRTLGLSPRGARKALGNPCAHRFRTWRPVLPSWQSGSARCRTLRRIRCAKQEQRRACAKRGSCHR